MFAIVETLDILDTLSTTQGGLNMSNNYIGQIEVADGFNGHTAIVHLVEIIGGSDYSYVVYAVHANGYYTYSM